MSDNDTMEVSPPRFDANGNPAYDPCAVGLHLCGFAGDPEQPYTAANIPAADHDKAREMFTAAKIAAECTREEADFCLDLNLGSASTGVEHVDDFWTNRQLWRALRSAVLQRETHDVR